MNAIPVSTMKSFDSSRPKKNATHAVSARRMNTIFDADVKMFCINFLSFLLNNFLLFQKRIYNRATSRTKRLTV